MDDRKDTKSAFNYKNIIIVCFVILLGIAGILFFMTNQKEEAVEDFEETDVLSDQIQP